MQYLRVKLNHAGSALLLAVTLCFQLPLAVQADDIKPFQAEAATVDLSPAVVPGPPQPQTTTLLQGAVRKRGSLSSPDGTTPSQDSVHSAGASDNDTQLQSESAAPDEQQKYRLAASRLASGAEMTPDDYRNLQIGTCGYLYRQLSTQAHAKVIEVYAGSPAEKAGILKGDVILSDSSAPPQDWSHSSWTFTFGHPGTLVNVKVLRGKQVLSFTLERINIEDLQDPKARLMYEQRARKLGPSGEGVVKESLASPLWQKLGKLLF